MPASQTRTGRPLRVVVVTGIFPPDIGGPATHAADLADELRRAWAFGQGGHRDRRALVPGRRRGGAGPAPLVVAGARRRRGGVDRPQPAAGRRRVHDRDAGGRGRRGPPRGAARRREGGRRSRVGARAPPGAHRRRVRRLPGRCRRGDPSAVDAVAARLVRDDRDRGRGPRFRAPRRRGGLGRWHRARRDPADPQRRARAGGRRPDRARGGGVPRGVRGPAHPAQARRCPRRRGVRDARRHARRDRGGPVGTRPAGARPRPRRRRPGALRRRARPRGAPRAPRRLRRAPERELVRRAPARRDRSARVRDAARHLRRRRHGRRAGRRDQRRARRSADGRRVRGRARPAP